MFRIVNKSEQCNISRCVSYYSMKIKCHSFDSIRYKSHYSVLGLDSSATQKDIKSAYYKLSMKFHPDKNFGNPESAKKFREITEAYEILGNPEKRKVYDEDYNMRPQYTEFKRNNYYNSSANFKRRQSPYTGRTKDFDYDEHFKRHYEDYYRQKEAEHEYFKRRWEADFRRRHPFSDDFSQQRYSWPEGYANKRFKHHIYLFLFTFWTALLLLQFSASFDNDNPKAGRIYYNVKKEAKNSEG